jgi:hypothetical protein
MNILLCNPLSLSDFIGRNFHDLNASQMVFGFTVSFLSNDDRQPMRRDVKYFLKLSIPYFLKKVYITIANT